MLVAFAEAVRPLAERTRSNVRRTQTRNVDVPDIFHFISRHMRVLQNETDAFCDQVDRMIEGRPDFDAHRTVLHMNVHVGRLLTSYDTIRRAKPGRGDSRGCSLLRELYRDVLLQIQSWLDDVIDIVNDPVSGLNKRGLSNEDDLTITLDFGSSMPKASALNRWTAQRAAKLKTGSRVDHVSILGGMATYHSLSSLFGNDK